MSDKVIYEYAIIRIVPSVERGEYMNVGVILYAKREKFLGMKYHIDERRLRAFSEIIDTDLLKEYLTAWEWVCEGDSRGGRIGQLEIQVRFRWLTAKRSTIIQSSEVHPGICNDPRQMLEKLFSNFVV